MLKRFIVGSLVLAAAVLAWADQPDDPRPRRLEVVLAAGTDAGAYADRHGLSMLRAVPNYDTYYLEMPPGSEGQENQYILDLLNDPETLFAEQGYEGEAPEANGRNFFLNVTPSAAPYESQAAWSQVNLFQAQSQGTGAGVRVALIDSGVDADHPALLGRIVAGGWNFVEDNADVSDAFNGVDDDGDGTADEVAGHGTHAAGVLAFIAPDAEILPIRILDSDGQSENFYLTQALYYAIDHGAQVIHVGIGSTYKSESVERAVDAARARGIVVVAPAGNLNHEEPREWPALMTAVLGVAAVDDADVKASFSNYHRKVAIAAPGTGIYSSIPGANYAQWDGTSMAAPMVSGAAALVRSKGNWPATRWTADTIYAFLTNSADAIDDVNPDYQRMLGSGRLDMDAAMQMSCVPACRGDTNCDGSINGLDIQPFIWALNDPARYGQEHPTCALLTADVNGDGSLNGTDIQPFIDFLWQ